MTRRVIIATANDPTLEKNAPNQPLKIGMELGYGIRSGHGFGTGYDHHLFSLVRPGQPDFYVGRMEDVTDAAWFQALRAESKASAIWRISDLEWDEKGRLFKVHVELLTDEDASAIRRERSTTISYLDLVKANWWPIAGALAALYFYLR
jgi:hypothetical protein